MILDTGFELHKFWSQAEIARSVRFANLQLGMLDYNMMPDDRERHAMCNLPRQDKWILQRGERVRCTYVLRKCV